MTKRFLGKLGMTKRFLGKLGMTKRFLGKLGMTKGGALSEAKLHSGEEVAAGHGVTLDDLVGVVEEIGATEGYGKMVA